MCNPNPVLNAIDVVLDWDLPDESFSFALAAQANLMAGIDPEEIIGYHLH